MLRRTPLREVPDGVPVTDLLARLGHFEVVVVDVDNTLAPDDAPAAEVTARVEAAREAARRAGIGRLVVASNGSVARATAGDGVVWEADKPFTRRSRLGIGPGTPVAIVGDKILTDGLLAHRWNSDFYLTRIGDPGSIRQGRLTRAASRLIRRLLFTACRYD